jgi:hypothetical protein
VDELRERLAALEHERWSNWQRWVHKVSHRNDDGSLTIPAAYVAKWDRQIATPYAELSEAEKDADRHEVGRYWALLPGVERAAAGRDDTATGGHR